MDGGDVSLAIRRARRSSAKHVDLSRRGLRTLPADLFALKQLQTLDLSGNELQVIDRAISELEQLEELNVASNKLASLPELDFDAMPNLQSLNIEGNPCAASLTPVQVRQLAHPSRQPGQTPAQVIRGVLAAVGGGGSAASGGYGGGLGPAPPMPASGVSSISAADGFGPAPPGPAPPRGSSAVLDFDRALAGDDAASGWRKEQKAMLQEMEKLRERIAELESQPGASKGSGAAAGGDASKPAWLQQSSMSATLPSRRGGDIASDEASQLKEQLREEQRKSKRLERDVERLTDRVKESSSMRAGGGAGAAPHFELSECDVGPEIAAGGFSTVHRGTWHSTKVCVKKIFDPNINEELLAEFDNEVQKLEQIRHPNIIILLAVHRKPPALSLITEMVDGGSLYVLLHSTSKFNFATPVDLQPKDLLEIMDPTGVAITYLHARGIAHRDIKTQNVLLSAHLEVKLCDFGLARMRSELNTGVMQSAGTPNYMAPEIFAQKAYTERVDVWAYGIMLWEAMVVDIPFANLDPVDIKDKVLRGDMPAMPREMLPGVDSVMRACWTIDHIARPPMAEILAQVRECINGVAAARSRRARPSTATGTGPPTGGRLSSSAGMGGGLGRGF